MLPGSGGSAGGKISGVGESDVAGESLAEAPDGFEDRVGVDVDPTGAPGVARCGVDVSIEGSQTSDSTSASRIPSAPATTHHPLCNRH